MLNRIQDIAKLLQHKVSRSKLVYDVDIICRLQTSLIADILSYSDIYYRELTVNVLANLGATEPNPRDIRATAALF